MLSKNVLYYGKDDPLPQQMGLRAGPLSLVYEEGDLRYIKLGDREILRRVYVAIRDRNWGTVLPVLSNVQMDIGDDSFRIRYDVENREGDINFFWKGTITGDAQGMITFVMEGVARSTFPRSRIGFCILHPMRECAGQPCTVEKADGTVEKGMFPRYIAPHQPFMNMQAISHQVIPGVWAKVRFEGDIFEMEDQRNWTDASYKTYCTPLALPFPVQVKEGTRVSQSVTLTLEGENPELKAGAPEAGLVFSVASTPTAPLPRLGLGVASHGQPLSRKELARLKGLNLSHLRVDLELSQPGYEAVLRQATAEASSLGVPMEVALTLTDAADELKALVAVLERAGAEGVGPAVCTWLIFHQRETSTSEKWVKLARQHLAGYDPAAKIGAGTNVFFAELNRGRPPVGALDLVTYSLNPQVHAFDNASLAETLEAQASTVESTRQFSHELPIAVSPVTFKMRFNPNATGPEPEPAPGELPSQVDVRQMSLFGAGWTVGSLKYLGESDAYSVTYYETSGWLGVMETEVGSPLPNVFRSLPGSVFPMYHVLADVGEFAGGEVLRTTTSDTLTVDGLALRKDGKTRVLLANLSHEPQSVSVDGLTQTVRVRHLNETNAEEAMRSPEDFRAQEAETVQTSEGVLALRLLPYAVVRIDTQ